jgi:hypothetical protein
MVLLRGTNFCPPPLHANDDMNIAPFTLKAHVLASIIGSVRVTRDGHSSPTARGVVAEAHGENSHHGLVVGLVGDLTYHPDGLEITLVGEQKRRSHRAH